MKLAVAVLLLAVSSFAQMTPKDDPKDLKLALERQKNAQLQAQLLQTQFQEQMKQLQDTYQAEEKNIVAQIEAVKKANGWGDEVTFNRQTGKFEKAPEKKH